MSDQSWTKLHKNYQKQDWINKPSLFAEVAINYFPANGRILELGAGQGQDSRFFAENGFTVVSTDVEDSALEISQSKTADELKSKIEYKKVDLRDSLDVEPGSFDVVYAHLSLHYFDDDTTKRIFRDIQAALKPGGVLAFFTNSTSDPEYGTGTKLEDNYFDIEGTAKRYLDTDEARRFTRYFEPILVDNLGETYKDAAIGVHNLIRFIGRKPLKESFTMAIPYVGAIIQRQHEGKKQLLLQTRWKPQFDPTYSGALEFPAGVLDAPYESVYEALAREVKEECGLTVASIIGDEGIEVTSGKNDSILGFQPFYCTQQLVNGKPWAGFIFVCEVEPGEPTPQESETKDPQWVDYDEVKRLVAEQPDKFFGLQLPALKYYFGKNLS